MTAKEKKPCTCADLAASVPFKVGDIVQLNSGGPLMTVEFVDGEYIEVVWFVHQGLHDRAFPYECLTLAPPDEMPF